MNNDPLDPKKANASELNTPKPISAPGAVADDAKAKAATLSAVTVTNNAVLDEATKQAFLWHTHGYLNDYARFADTKAAFSGGASGALLGYLYSAKAFTPLVTSSWHQWSKAAWLTAGAGIILSGAAGLAIWTIRPRLKTTQAKGYIFWGSVAAHREVADFKTSFHSLSERELNDHLIGHIFDIAKHVCIPKYRAVSICLLMLFLGVFLGAASLILQGRDALKASSPEANAPVKVLVK